MVKDTTAKMSRNVPASIYMNLVWMQVRRPSIGPLLQHTTSTLYSMCLYSPDQTLHSALSSSRTKGQMTAQSASCQIYNIREALRHILTFSQHNTWQSMASPGRCNLYHPQGPWGWTLLYCVNLAQEKLCSTSNYIQLIPLKLPLTVTVQTNLQCSILKWTTLIGSLWMLNLASFDCSNQCFFCIDVGWTKG